MTPENAAVYCRLSYAPDGSVEKVERQEADCRALADRLGWRVAKVFSDNSRSAWQRNRKRPAWDAMLDDIGAGRLDGILIYHGDRLVRQPWDLELLLRLADERHLPLASPSGTRDLSSEDDRFVLRVEAAQACRSSADTSRRVKRGWQARAERGQSIGGGKRPFGFGVPTGKTTAAGNPHYDVTRQVPEEAAILQQAVGKLLAGQSLGGVLAWMNTVSTTTQGRPWTGKALKNVLRSPRIAGLVEHQGTLHPAVWEPIVTREQWEDVRALLARNGERYGYPGRQRRYLLSGIATCSGCGSTVRTKPSGGRNRPTSRLYYCPNAGCRQRVSRSVAHLDAYVDGRVLRRLNEPSLLKALYTDAEQPSLSAEIAALGRRKRDAVEALEALADHPEVDPGLVARSLASFDKKIAELRAQLAATQQQRLLARVAGITREQWLDEPVDVRAEIVRALFTVTILPATWRGPGFDPASVDVRRRPAAAAGPVVTGSGHLE